MVTDEQLLDAILDEYKETYKTWLYLEDKTTPTANGLCINLRMLQIEFYKCKCQILEKELKMNKQPKEYFCGINDTTCRFLIPKDSKCDCLYSCTNKQKNAFVKDCKHPYTERMFIGNDMQKCCICGKEFEIKVEENCIHIFGSSRFIGTIDGKEYKKCKKCNHIEEP